MLGSLTNDVLKLLKRLPGRTLIIFIGNPLRGDDGIGPFIGERIKETDDLKIINAGVNPENVIDHAISIKPERIIIIDAANFNGHTGEARVIDKNNLPETSLSTHSIPLTVFTSILEEDANCKVYFLGIQVASIDFGREMSGEVKSTGEAIIDLINREYSNA